MYFPFSKNKAFDTYDDGTTYIAEILPGLYHIAMGYDHIEDADFEVMQQKEEELASKFYTNKKILLYQNL